MYLIDITSIPFSLLSRGNVGAPYVCVLLLLHELRQTSPHHLAIENVGCRDLVQSMELQQHVLGEPRLLDRSVGASVR